MNLTARKTNLHRVLFSGAALASMLGGMILNVSSAKAIDVRTAANLEGGMNRISVDLSKYVKQDLKNRVNPNCTGNLDSGKLAINCDLSKYVEGNGFFPFSKSLTKGIPVKVTEASLDRGISRISVDLSKYVKKDLKGRVRPYCTGDLNSGNLAINCDLSKYVEGDGFFPFSKSNTKHDLED